MISHPNQSFNTDHGLRIPRSGRGSNKASQVVSQRNPCTDFRIGTWNVRTLFKTGKLEEVKNEMEEAHLDILGLCETRWAGNGDFIQDDVRIIYSGSEKSGRNGVAVILKGKWKQNVLNTYHVDDRTMIKLQAAPTNIYVIQVYFPTSNSSDDEIEIMYSKLEKLLNLTEEK